MWSDVVDLNEFYASPLGQVARRMIRRKLRQLWPNVRGQSVLGLGYATPYLHQFRDEAARVIAVMGLLGFGFLLFTLLPARLTAFDLYRVRTFPAPGGFHNFVIPG